MGIIVRFWCFQKSEVTCREPWQNQGHLGLVAPSGGNTSPGPQRFSFGFVSKQWNPETVVSFWFPFSTASKKLGTAGSAAGSAACSAARTAAGSAAGSAACSAARTAACSAADGGAASRLGARGRPRNRKVGSSAVDAPFGCSVDFWLLVCKSQAMSDMCIKCILVCLSHINC